MRIVLSSSLMLILLVSAWSFMQPRIGSATATTRQGNPEATPVTMYRDCPVTLPVLADPPEPEQPAGMERSPLGLDWWYVSDGGLLWTGAIPYHETGGEKMLWLKPIGAALSVTGQTLGGDGPPLSVSIPEGYPGDYQATGIHFPVAGCWEVTARANDSELRFVTIVFEEGGAPRSGEPGWPSP